jgi:HigB_toxin, RelE-like toxic component of a toxin-antitoxin system
MAIRRSGCYEKIKLAQSTPPVPDLVPTKGRDLHIFNIGGNKYRLVAAIHFNTQRLFVRHILTHPEYDAGRWKK